MHRVERSGRTLACAVAGTGPWFLLPWCNVAWFDFSDLHGLTRTHRVIVASPLGFGQSDRAADGGYSADGLVDDLLHICGSGAVSPPGHPALDAAFERAGGWLADLGQSPGGLVTRGDQGG